MNAICREDLKACASALDAVRVQRPKVHCITNSVVQNFTANMLLAFGAIPSMTINPLEIADFVGGADALLLNLGTVDKDREAAIPIAMQAADERHLPIVLDPVFIDRSPGRAAYAGTLMTHGPTIVRANRSEWETLFSHRPDVPAAGGFETRLLATLSGTPEPGPNGGSVAVVTGSQDLVVGAGKSVSFAGGHPWMAMVTGVGCGQAAIMGALAACSTSPFHAALAGLLVFGLCGERAANVARGPGSFEPALLDALHDVTGADIEGMGHHLWE